MTSRSAGDHPCDLARVTSPEHTRLGLSIGRVGWWAWGWGLRMLVRAAFLRPLPENYVPPH